MGYTFACDGCGTAYDHAPPFMGEFSESFLNGTAAGGEFSEIYNIGQTVTLCVHCSRETLL